MVNIKEFIERLIRNTKEAEVVIDGWIENALKRFKLPRKDDLDSMEQKIKELEEKLHQLEGKSAEENEVSDSEDTAI